MKKSFFAFATAIAFGFVAAVGLCVRALNGATAAAAFDEGLKIVIDAGHGGIDGGVMGRRTGVKESDLNLSISYAIKDVLEDMGFDVTMTRKTQAGLYDTTAKGFKKRDMQKRKEIIQEVAPDFVLSVHQNYYPSSASRGGQAFYQKENEKGRRFASVLQDKINDLYAQSGVKARKIATGDFFMLKCYPCPSVLIECGFLSNADDEALLCTEKWQRKFAEYVAAGVLEFLSNGSVCVF